MVTDHNTQEVANLENNVPQELGMVFANCIATLLAPTSKIARCFVAPVFIRCFCSGSFFALGRILSPISSTAYVFCSISHFAIHVGKPDFVLHLDSK